MRKAAKTKRAKKKRKGLVIALEGDFSYLPPRPEHPDPTRDYAEDVKDEKPQKPVRVRRRKMKEPDDGIPF